MTFKTFQASLTESAPPETLSPALKALWQDAKGNWDAAHDHTQSDESAAGAWVHAYLHRKEGDDTNAGYWYRRADKPAFTGASEQEWEEIVKGLLEAKE